MVYPYTPRQRCWVHKLRNVAGYLPRRFSEKCLSGAKTIYLSEGRKEAIASYKQWASSWEALVPKAVNCLGKDLDELLTFFSCPKEHWVKIRTTNYIERVFREVRRRTRPISTFTNRSSCDRIIFGIFCYQNKKWEGKPLKEFTQKT